jgi:hypothetical protein
MFTLTCNPAFSKQNSGLTFLGTEPGTTVIQVAEGHRDDDWGGGGGTLEYCLCDWGQTGQGPF